MKNNKNLKLIAQIYSLSPCIKSKFGDDNLMFSHMDFRDDVEVNNNWADAAPSFA
jgi:hypothetical protein